MNLRRRAPGPWLYALHLWTLFGLAVSNAFLALALLAVPWTAAASRTAWRRARPLLVPLGLYSLLLVASSLASYEPRTSLPAVGELFALAAVLAGLAVVRGERIVRTIVDGFVAMVSLTAVWGIAQLFFGYGDLHHRIRGPFSHYMTFAGVLLLGDCLLLARLTRRGTPRRPWPWLGLALINVALVATLTRSAWVALAVAVALFLVLTRPRWLLAYLPVAVILLLLAPRLVVERIGSITDLSDVTNYDRLCMLEAGCKMVRERPLFGIGPNLVKERYPIYRHPTAPRLWVPHLHDTLLELTAERGLTSLAAFLWLLAGTCWYAFRAFRRVDGTGAARDLHLGVILAVVAFLVAGIFEDNWGDTEVQRVVLFVLVIPYAAEARDVEGRGTD